MSSAPHPAAIQLEVLAYGPTDFFHCAQCEHLFDAVGIGEPVHQEIQTAYPAEVLEEANRLAAWLRELAAQYGERLRIRIVDPQSLEGLLKSLRHRVRRYPTFIVNRQATYTGWEPAALERLLTSTCPKSD
jgi:hypothetical protein